jgi:hypothetical protein
MKRAVKYLLVGLVGDLALAVPIMPASAAIVCNNAGDCWHSHEEHAYRPEFGVVVHPDGWAWKEGEHHRWREHDGRGYWDGDNWKDF